MPKNRFQIQRRRVLFFKKIPLYRACSKLLETERERERGRGSDSSARGISLRRFIGVSRVCIEVRVSGVITIRKGALWATTSNKSSLSLPKRIHASIYRSIRSISSPPRNWHNYTGNTRWRCPKRIMSSTVRMQIIVSIYIFERERGRERVSGRISCGAPFPFKIRAGLAWPTVTIIQKRGYECRPRSNRDAGRMEKLLPPPITHDNAAMVITTGWGGEGWTGWMESVWKAGRPKWSILSNQRARVLFRVRGRLRVMHGRNVERQRYTSVIGPRSVLG